MGKHIFNLSGKQLGLWLAFLSSFFFAFYPSAARAAYEHGANFIFISMFQLFFRGAATTSYCLYKKRKPFSPTKSLKWAILAGSMQTTTSICLFSALSFLQGPIVLIIIYTFPLIILLFEMWRGEAKFNIQVLGLTLASFFGLTLVLDLWSQNADIHWGGVALAFSGSIFTAARLYLIGKLMRHKDPIVVGSENFIIACTVALFLPLWMAPVPPQDLIGYAWSGLAFFALVMGTFLSLWGMALLGTFSFSLLSKMEPVIVTLLAIVLIGEYLRPIQYIGIVVVLASLIAYQLVTKKAKTPVSVGAD